MIRAVLFDFDGLIIETEEPLYIAWQRIYRDHGQELPFERWLTNIGTWPSPFDPVVDLAERTGRPVDEPGLNALKRRYYDEAMAVQALMPGVEQYLHDAEELGLQLAVVSSSSRKWIVKHLDRFSIRGRFDAIVCKDDVARAKPDPELYLTALRRLEVKAEEAIALEDSNNGIRAARAAGIPCVAVPTTMTATMDLTQADLKIASLETVPLRDLILRLSSARSQPPGQGRPGAQTSG
ncbi:MAG TPA: HAD family hydrolase [Candidatus Dormibacteraeota bacterium]